MLVFTPLMLVSFNARSALLTVPLKVLSWAMIFTSRLQLLEEQKFDLILLDMMMPDMDGLETLKRIRQKFAIPVVIMTADKTLDTSVEFTKFGCDDYLTKPLQPLLLKEIVHNMTENEKTLYSELQGKNV